MNNKTRFGILLISGLVPVAVAAAQPDAGQILNEQQQLQQQRLDRLPQEEGQGERPALRDIGGVRVLVRAIRFSGGEGLAGADELQAQVADAIGRELGYAELQQLADRITQYLRNKGYMLARAYLPRQDVTEGTIEIAIVEGRIQGDADGIVIRGDNLRIAEERLRAIAEGAVHPGEPANRERLERGVLLINDLPGMSARSTLEKGDEAGASKLVVQVDEGALLTGSAWLDNYGNRFTGSGRANAQLNLNDPLRIGDQFNFSLTHATDLDLARVGYSLPVGSGGLRVGGAFSYLDYEVGKELSSLDARGKARTATLNASYPFVRTRNFSLWGGLAYDHKALEDETLGVKVHDKRLNNVTASLNGNRWDRWGGGGISSFAVSLTRGELDLSGVAVDLAADRLTARTDGGFTKANYSLARLQKLTGRLALFGAVNGQFASDNLDSSEKFILGGPSGIRAYPVGEASADEGWVANLELRYDLPVLPALGNLQLVSFVDTGRAKLHESRWTGSVTNAENDNSYSLSGAGFGLNLTRIASHAVRVAWAHTLGDNPGRSATTGNDSDGKSRDSRFWLQGLIWF